MQAQRKVNRLSKALLLRRDESYAKRERKQVRWNRRRASDRALTVSGPQGNYIGGDSGQELSRTWGWQVSIQNTWKIHFIVCLGVDLSSCRQHETARIVDIHIVHVTAVSLAFSWHHKVYTIIGASLSEPHNCWCLLPLHACVCTCVRTCVRTWRRQMSGSECSIRCLRTSTVSSENDRTSVGTRTLGAACRMILQRGSDHHEEAFRP